MCRHIALHFGHLHVHGYHVMLYPVIQQTNESPRMVLCATKQLGVLVQVKLEQFHGLFPRILRLLQNTLQRFGRVELPLELTECPIADHYLC